MSPPSETVYALHEDQLRLSSVIQRLVYRCISMSVDAARQKRPEKFPAIIDLLRTWLHRFVTTGEIHTMDVIFNETIWPPSQPERHGTVVQVLLVVGSHPDPVLVEIDLMKGYRDCAAFLTPEQGRTPINPFSVVFRDVG